MAKKRFRFIYNIIKHYFESYFDRKQINKKTAFFDQKHGQMRFLGLWEIEFFMAKKGFLSI